MDVSGRGKRQLPAGNLQSPAENLPGPAEWAGVRGDHLR